MASDQIRMGVDIGGTFTDVVIEVDATLATNALIERWAAKTALINTDGLSDMI